MNEKIISRIQTNTNGDQRLLVFYHGDEFEEAIQRALERHGYLSGEISVLAVPETMMPKMDRSGDNGIK